MSQTAEPIEGSIIKDAELKAINNIVKALAVLEQSGQQRILNYLNSRYLPVSKAYAAPKE